MERKYPIKNLYLGLYLYKYFDLDKHQPHIEKGFILCKKQEDKSMKIVNVYFFENEIATDKEYESIEDRDKVEGLAVPIKKCMDLSRNQTFENSETIKESDLNQMLEFIHKNWDNSKTSSYRRNFNTNNFFKSKRV